MKSRGVHCCSLFGLTKRVLFIKIAGLKELKSIFLYLNSSKQPTFYILNDPTPITFTPLTMILPIIALFVSLSTICDILPF